MSDQPEPSTDPLDGPELPEHLAEAESLLIDIWLDGCTSGALSVLATFASDIPEEESRVVVADLIEAITSDPRAIDTVRTAIHQRVKGLNLSGYRRLTIDAVADSEEPQ